MDTFETIAAAIPSLDPFAGKAPRIVNYATEARGVASMVA